MHNSAAKLAITARKIIDAFLRHGLYLYFALKESGMNKPTEKGSVAHSIRNNGLTDLTFIVVTTPVDDK
jgi:hypothetical protein